MIAIWGANGFIGRHLVRALQEQGAEECRLFARDFDGFPFPVPPTMACYEADFKQPDSYLRALKGCRTLVLLVSASGARRFADDPAAEIAENVMPYRALFQSLATESHDIERLVFLSSGGAVYGAGVQEPVAEDAPLAPVSPYGCAKKDIEAALMAFAAETGCDSVILRPSNPVGLWAKRPHIVGAALHSAKTGAVLPIFGDGQTVRDFFSVRDLAEAISLACRHPAAKNQIFNIGSGKPCTVNEVIAMVRETTGAALPVAYREAHAADVPYNVLDCRKIGAALGWRPEQSLEDVIKEMWTA